MSKSRKGWAVRVQIDALADGTPGPEKWQDLPILVMRNIQAISEAPLVASGAA